MSFNVRAFNRFKWLDRKKVPESIAKFIQKKSPDIICFQEYDNKLSPNFDESYYVLTEDECVGHDSAKHEHDAS